MPSLRDRLLKFREFPGALFELEVLAELHTAQTSPEILAPPLPDFAARAGHRVLIEARRRGVPNPMLLAMEVFAAFGAGRRTRSPGRLFVRVEPWLVALQPVERAASEVVTRIETALAAGNTWYRDDGIELTLEQGPDTSAHSMQIRTTDFTYDEDLRHLIFLTLKEKEERLVGKRDAETRCVIAVDFQCLLPSVPSYAADEIKTEVARIRDGLIAGMRQFLDEAPDVSAVLCWWARPVDVIPADWFARPAEITLTTPAGEDIVETAADLRVQLHDLA